MGRKKGQIDVEAAGPPFKDGLWVTVPPEGGLRHKANRYLVQLGQDEIGPKFIICGTDREGRVAALTQAAARKIWPKIMPHVIRYLKRDLARHDRT